MSYVATQGQPIFVDLVSAARNTGWSVDGNIAKHTPCNSGNITMTAFPLTAGQTYTAVFEVISISGGNLQLTLGGVAGVVITSAGFYQQTSTAINNDTHFFSNANCQVELFSIQVQGAPISPMQQNTIAYSDRNDEGDENTDKWGAWYTKVPDIGTSLFEDTYEFLQGALYISEHNSTSRCNFFGVQFPATIQFVANKNATIAKTFIGLNYQANTLMVSPSGIATSLGQASELIAGNFTQATYNEGTVIDVSEGVYRSSFMRDSNIDIVNGDPLKGSWATILLQTASPSSVLELYSTEVIYAKSFQSGR